MKKIILTILSITLLASCGTRATSAPINTSISSITPIEKVSIIAPEGTPSLALANFHANNKDLYEKFDIKAGSDPLVAAFSSQSYDVIVAPTNLGAKFYNANQNYLLYQTIVWGNLYLASKTEINSFSDISNKTVTYFGGQSATPYIVLKSLIDSGYAENVTLINTDDVATANAKLMSNEADIVVSAQPALTKIKKQASSKGTTIYTIDLQQEWAKLTGSSSYPQASIFFHKNLAGKIDNILEALTLSVTSTVASPSTSADNAVSMYTAFENLGKDVLVEAIPQAHYGIDDNQKAAIEFYFNKMNSLGLSQAYGGLLPNDDFYYKK